MNSPDPGVVIIWTDTIRPKPPAAVASSERSGARDWRKPSRRVLLLSVPLVYLAMLLIGPLIAVFRSAFADGVGAFFAAVTSANALYALLMTLAMSAFAIVLNTVFGVAAAWTICRDRFPGRSLLGGLVDLPFAVSPVVVGLTAMLLFGRHGWFGPWLKEAGIKVLFSWPAMALVTTFVSLPCVVREVTPVLEEIGLSEEEAARILGASPVQTFVRVVLPNIRWAIGYGVALTAARALGEFGGVLLVSGGLRGKTETATLLIYRELEERHDASAHAMAVVLACASVAILVAMEFLKHRRDRDLGQAGSKS